jgi:tripartite-type tricarboxylate transporter receptor subunit TctC
MSLIIALPVLCAVALAVSLPRASAQAFPARTVRLVVPYPVSGPKDIRGTARMTKTHQLIAQAVPPPISDVLARMAADAIAQGTRHEVKLERQPGGATTQGATTVARSRPDGHTLLLASDATLLIAPRYYVKVRYTGVNDFVPVAPLAAMPFVLMADYTLPFDDVRGLIDWLRVRPGEANYGSSGDGSTGHLAGELFRHMAGVNVVHVSYNGGLDALTGIARRHVAYVFAALPLALPYLDNRYVRPLAVTTSRRLPHLPGLPTLAESGLEDYELEGWYAIVAGARAPPAAIAWFTEHIAAYMAKPDVKGTLRQHGLEPIEESPAQFATRIQSQALEYGPIVRRMKAIPQPPR